MITALQNSVFITTGNHYSMWKEEPTADESFCINTQKAAHVSNRASVGNSPKYPN